MWNKVSRLIKHNGMVSAITHLLLLLFAIQCAIGLIGYSTEEVMGRSLVQEFITEDFKMPVQAVLDKALAGNETGNFEVSVHAL